MARKKLFDRDKMLQKAMELFWQKGFYDTSVNDIVSYLHISRASLYGTFGLKNDLFNESLDLYCETNKAMTLEFLKSQKSVKKGIRHLFNLAIVQLTSDRTRKGCFVVNTTTELIPQNNNVKKVLIDNKHTFEDMFYQFLKTGEESGEIPSGKNLRAIASLIYILFNGINVISKIECDSEKLMESVDIVLTTLD